MPDNKPPVAAPPTTLPPIFPNLPTVFAAFAVPPIPFKFFRDFPVALYTSLPPLSHIYFPFFVFLSTAVFGTFFGLTGTLFGLPNKPPPPPAEPWVEAPLPTAFPITLPKAPVIFPPLIKSAIPLRRLKPPVNKDDAAITWSRPVIVAMLSVILSIPSPMPQFSNHFATADSFCFFAPCM